MNILKPEIHPNLSENCRISAIFRALKTPKSLKLYTVKVDWIRLKTFWRFFSPKKGRNLAILVEFRVQKGHLLVGTQCLNYLYSENKVLKNGENISVRI